MDALELVHRFRRNEVSEADVTKMETLRDEMRLLAMTVNALVPDSREKSLALTALEESLMWANKAISTPPYIRTPKLPDVPETTVVLDLNNNEKVDAA